MSLDSVDGLSALKHFSRKTSKLFVDGCEGEACSQRAPVYTACLNGDLCDIEASLPALT